MPGRVKRAGFSVFPVSARREVSVTDGTKVYRICIVIIG